MTGEVFSDNFQKVYAGKNEKPYIFKAAYGLLMLGEAISEVERRVIGIGITPDTLIGIRLCREDIFYLRELDSEVMYECRRTELGVYRENNWAKDIFHLIGRLTKSINAAGAQILFYKEGKKEEFESYSAAAAIGFSDIFCKSLNPAALLGVILPDNINFADNAKELISLEAAKDRFAFVENQIPIYLPASLSGYKIIIVLTGEKPFKNPDFKRVLDRMKETGRGEVSSFSHISRDEIGLYRDLPEYYLALFARNESERITAGAEALKRGDINLFGDIVKQSGKEYLAAAGKSSSNIELLFEFASEISYVCGIYKNRGVFAVVADGEVDKFVAGVGEMYEKKAGSKPEFYICADSATEEVVLK